ncbi:hypothetical protein K502DRAFT_204704 [Neoconidiobolus thromboides FSU 785]|nr:hypothetical protein K502DRAFT_204704 [Neoconidiobolus thromboides FSU 785]
MKIFMKIIKVKNINIIRKLALIYVHQLFIQDPKLIPLIHKQMYNSDLLEPIFKYVPSTIVMQDYLPSLLKDPVVDRRWFALELTSQLITRFPLEVYKEMIEQVVQPILIEFFIDKCLLNQIHNEYQLYLEAKQRCNSNIQLQIEREMERLLKVKRLVKEEKVDEIVLSFIKLFTKLTDGFLELYNANRNVWSTADKMISLLKEKSEQNKFNN